MGKWTLYLLLITLLCGQVYAQSDVISEIILEVDTLEFSSERNGIEGESKSIYFIYDEENETALVTIKLEEVVDSIELLSSKDFEVIDSLIVFNQQAQFKVRFFELTNSQFLRFRFNISVGGVRMLEEVSLQPVYQSFVEFTETTYELFIGEVKRFALNTNNPDNLLPPQQWQREHVINHAFSNSSGEWFLEVLPTATERHSLSVRIPLKKPFLNKDGRLQYELPPIPLVFDVKESRLVFLQIDKDEVTPNDDKTEPILVQIQNHRLLRIGKTYRIENQEEIGGPLIAEIFTKSRLTNDRVLCELRPYAYHRRSDGYLYIKDGDVSRFITNIEISPKTQIQQIAIQRNGKDWQNSNVLYPGENVNIRLSGIGLHKANISFGGIRELGTDSLLRNENIALFNITVPASFERKTIEIFNWNTTTGKTLQIKEFERPREFDFIKLDLGTSEYNLQTLNRPIYFENTLTDLIVSFDRSKIDANGDFHGVQYVDMEVRVFNKAGSLLEIHKINDYGVCPNQSSPRAGFYTSGDCKLVDININTLLKKKTYDLEEWSRIEITVNHSKQRYASGTRQKTATIYLKRTYNFDIDVSFPAGLLILKSTDGNDQERQITNFSAGISVAMIAQFSFYQEGKIAKYKPYKVGAGFIAIDALNFSENSDNRDVALVAIGSLYPISSDRKLTFPLYTGFGYLLQESKFFFLIGPGIRVRF